MVTVMVLLLLKMMVMRMMIASTVSSSAERQSNRVQVGRRKKCLVDSGRQRGPVVADTERWHGQVGGVGLRPFQADLLRLHGRMVGHGMQLVLSMVLCGTKVLQHVTVVHRFWQRLSSVVQIS